MPKLNSNQITLLQNFSKDDKIFRFSAESPARPDYFFPKYRIGKEYRSQLLAIADLRNKSNDPKKPENAELIGLIGELVILNFLFEESEQELATKLRQFTIDFQKALQQEKDDGYDLLFKDVRLNVKASQSGLNVFWYFENSTERRCDKYVFVRVQDSTSKSIEATIIGFADWESVSRLKTTRYLDKKPNTTVDMGELHKLGILETNIFKLFNI